MTRFANVTCIKVCVGNSCRKAVDNLTYDCIDAFATTADCSVDADQSFCCVAIALLLTWKFHSRVAARSLCSLCNVLMHAFACHVCEPLPVYGMRFRLCLIIVSVVYTFLGHWIQ